MRIGKYEIDGKKIAVGALKLVAGGIVSFGAGYIITRYGKAAILPNDKKIKKLVMAAGAATLASMVGDAASNYVGNQIDGCAKLIEGVTTGIVDDDDDDEEDEEEDEDDVRCEQSDDTDDE